MAEQTISTFLELKDRLSPGLRNVGARLDKVGSVSAALGTKIGDLSIGAVSAIGGISSAIFKTIDAWNELTKEGIDLNRQFENTSVRIAGTLKAFNIAPTFAKAQAQAAGVMTTIADLAAKLPGETEDYVSVFAMALPKAIAAGLTDMQEVAQFTSHWTAVATSNMVDAQQAGMDLFRVLSGQAGADVRMFTVLAEKIGMTAEAFNKLSAPERLAKIQDAIGAFDAQLLAAGDTFDAKAGEFESRLKEIKRVGSEISFDMAKKSLEEMNERLKENRNELTATVDMMTGAFTFYSTGAKGVLTDLGIVASKLLNTLILSNAELAAIRGTETRKGETPEDRLRKLAQPQEAAEAARRERREYYQAAKFGQIEAMLPEKMQRGLGPSGMATPKVFDELVKLGRSRKDDIEFRNRLLDYAEFMKMDEEALYLKISGRMSKEQEKVVKAEKPKRETTKAPNFDFRNSRFDIRQQFAEGFDPDRIAVAFSQDLGRLGEMKVQSGLQPTLAGK